MIRRPFTVAAAFLGIIAALVVSGCDRAQQAPATEGRDARPEPDPCHASAATRPVNLPSEISDFKAAIRDKGPHQVLAAALARFGRPAREIGSGIAVPQWDVAGGTLSLHPLRGPYFESGSGSTVWLNDTENPARESVVNDFEMITVPTPSSPSPDWIGDLHIAVDLDYRFVVQVQYLAEYPGARQPGNFFISHPSGHVAVNWLRGLDADTLLESIGEREIAELTFTDDAGKATYRCRVISVPGRRMLTVCDPRFIMNSIWLHDWPARAD